MLHWKKCTKNYLINMEALGNFDWKCKHTWKISAKNTFWCLLGCAIGDFGTILFFQLTQIPFPVFWIMVLAIINWLITSVILETIILIRQNLIFSLALKTALGMSFISMISMEITMNFTDYLLTGGQVSPSESFYWIALIISFFMGFIVPLPYNYYKFRRHKIACH